MSPQCLIAIAYEWPSRLTGSGIALSSSLPIYCANYSEVVFVACTEEDHGQDTVNSDFLGVRFEHIAVNKTHPASRFAKSILSPWPALCSQFRNKSVIERIDRIINECLAQHSEVHIVFEHLAPSVLLHLCESMSKVSKVAFRSYDVLQNAFEGITVGKPSFVRRAWEYEIRRVKRLEERTISRSDVAWAITEEDRAEYESVGLQIDGVFGVQIDVDQYDHVEAGDIEIVTYLGSFDARKKSGLEALVNQVWPLVRKAKPNVILQLGGKGSLTLHDPDRGVHGVGFVDDEVEFIGRGKLFVNPQIIGSGIKLKSLNAMAASRTLVSFDNGVRGICGQNGKHFLQCSSASDMASKIIEHVEQPSRAHQIGISARRFIRNHYSAERLTANVSSLLHALANHGEPVG